MNRRTRLVAPRSVSAAPFASSSGGGGTAVGAVLIEEEISLLEGVPDEMLLPMPDILERDDAEPFRYCLNTSTVKGQGLSLPELVDVAAGAGYEAIEPWIEEIEKYAAEGGDLRDLHTRIQDLGLTVESAIGFFEWAVDDPERRKAGLEKAKRDMGLLARVGGKRIAAPAFGAHEAGSAPLSLPAVSARYRDLLEAADSTGVVPQVEVWGFSANLSRLCEAAYIAVDSGHPDACILADVYHLHKGGSPVSGLSLLGGDGLKVFHVNDYPAVPIEDLKDGDRVYPGDGVAPLQTIFRTLRDIGFSGCLSLELFNKEYWAQDPLTVARTGLEKLREQVQQSFD